MNVPMRFSAYLRPRALRIAEAVLAMCAVALFNGAAVLILKPIVDKVLIAKDFGMLWLAVVAVPLVMSLKTMASYAQNYLMSWLGQRVTQDIREDLFRHLHALPLEFYASHQSGEILSRATGDLTIVQSALTSVPLYLIRDSMTVAILTGALFYLDWRLALLSFLALPLAFSALLVLSRKMRDSSLESQAMQGRLYQRFQESVEGMPVIKAFDYDEGVLSKFLEENASFYVPMMRYLRATALSAPLLEFCGGLIAALILYLGGREVILGRMTPGAFFAFLAAFFAAYAPLKNLARSNSELQRALASAERIFQLLDEPPAPRASRGAAHFPGLARGLAFDSVSFRYPGRDDWALREVSFTVLKGARVALVGPSGSGKSTVAKLLLRLHDCESGRVLYDDRDSRELDARSLRAQVGLVTQETLLFNDTVFENVALGRKVATLSDVEAACRIAGADSFIAKLPEGYRTRLGERGLSLSAGQRQRLAIARVVFKNPSILILDEATASLDAAGEAEVLSALERLFAGRTVIMIAHKLSALPRMDEILLLSDGRLFERGDHSSLMARRGFYRRLYEFQKSEPENAAGLDKDSGA